MSLYPSSSKTTNQPRAHTSSRFLREDDDVAPSISSWEEQLAAKYYNNLYREFALCNLKHYKTGNFALRWRTEEEVLSGAGETTCGNTRCRYHDPPRRPGDVMPKLTTLELPFTYEEHGEHKYALVKVVLCGKCVDKLMWKRRKDKEKMVESTSLNMEEVSAAVSGVVDEGESKRNSKRHHHEQGAIHERTSRSRSPHRGYSGKWAESTK
ncbi:folate-sensitive fragile site protein Fra10Ac1-domain-containing protein [Cyathus striatus]|nr:folate-sensitive fragile site protein Fra10Ac1-domain-containing protein [Cyathus striatus]